jgi:hypothetical protein
VPESTVNTHALARAVTRMARDGVVDLDRRRAMLGYDQLGEIEHQFQLPVEGTVAANPSWTDVTIEFDVDFFEAQQQRDSPLTLPQVWVGATLSVTDDDENDTGSGVAYSVIVTDWNQDDRGAYIGCSVRMGIWAPGLTGGTVNVEGLIHLTFQGYGAPTENSPDLDVGT